jgi:hypothetical protein
VHHALRRAINGWTVEVDYCPVTNQGVGAFKTAEWGEKGEVICRG